MSSNMTQDNADNIGEKLFLIIKFLLALLNYTSKKHFKIPFREVVFFPLLSVKMIPTNFPLVY